MAYRFTNTDKWNDNWFSGLKPIEKLLFMYLCDNCDIAGFIEINLKRWCADIDTDKKVIEGALKGLQRGLIYSKLNDCIFLRNFLKHQKNLPLNQNNQAHKGICNRFISYSEKFEIKSVDDFIKGASKGLQRGYGNGNGNDILVKVDLVDILWRKDFKVYLNDCLDGYKTFMEDEKLLKEQERLNPGIDVRLTIEKGYKNFWGTEAGWKNKKATKTNVIDWKRTIINSISSSMNKAYLKTK